MLKKIWIMLSILLLNVNSVLADVINWDSTAGQYISHGRRKAFNFGDIRICLQIAAIGIFSYICITYFRADTEKKQKIKKTNIKLLILALLFILIPVIFQWILYLWF